MLFTQTPTQDFKPLISIIRPAQETPKPEPITYTIKDGDVLEKVALDQHTTVQKLFNKNLAISDPNVIEVGQTLVIPAEDEVLTHRDIISTTPPKTPPGAEGTAVTGGSSSSGNLYTPGNCTWLVKDRRPELPNNLGNAYSWFDNAVADGLGVSYTPQVGSVAVAKSYSHVALVTAVHGDTVDLIEMNYKGLYVISTRTAPISEFRYIL